MTAACSSMPMKLKGANVQLILTVLHSHYKQGIGTPQVGTLYTSCITNAVFLLATTVDPCAFCSCAQYVGKGRQLHMCRGMLACCCSSLLYAGIVAIRYIL